ncbi:hypothetical protein RB614_40330 [Phytohabitans sp. ZYX-F-186]|uniref:Helix-turn-helix domain-containing protein n=1 Tax=Phytohabitans maris TaxID=3071409 RepID=A0ABU0ZW76_9ACTN|nr:hypothetical protein [Phytohabitans sp. ZYX-F-186]MDQ7910757.1 hypothetical protein [Phytohabitans sp. ZYX-F-186]
MEVVMLEITGAPGWLAAHLSGDGPPLALLKFEPRDGRAVITRLVIVGEAIDSSMLRAIPIGRIESDLNHPRYGFPGALRAELPHDVLAEMAARGELFPEEFAAIDRALDRYLSTAGNRTPTVGRNERRRPRASLTRPDGSDPDGFSRRVADAYNEAVVSTRKPAMVLAEEAGVPVTTVHRWIAEARRRGHLPPARKGRAG